MNYILRHLSLRRRKSKEPYVLFGNWIVFKGFFFFSSPDKVGSFSVKRTARGGGSVVRKHVMGDKRTVRSRSGVGRKLDGCWGRFTRSLGTEVRLSMDSVPLIWSGFGSLELLFPGCWIWACRLATSTNITAAVDHNLSDSTNRRKHSLKLRIFSGLRYKTVRRFQLPKIQCYTPDTTTPSTPNDSTQ